MALATRCPHCQTAFRVASDQLKLRAGLVRCGTCKEIFNGIENLLHPDDDIPATSNASGAAAGSRWPLSDTPKAPIPTAPVAAVDQPAASTSGPALLSAPAAYAAGYTPVQLPAPPHEPDSASLWLAASDDFDLEATRLPTADGLPEAQDEGGGGDRDRHDLGAAIAQPSMSPMPGLLRPSRIGDAHVSPPADAPSADTSADSPADSATEPLNADATLATDAIDEAEHVPDFVAQDLRRQGLRRIARPLLAIASVVLALLLLGQMAYVFRTSIAANFPQTRSLLDDTCRMIGCSVGLPMQIDFVTIEASDFQPLPDKRDQFVFTVLLRNRSATVQAWPSIELSLNDAADKLVARRIIAPRDYLPPGAVTAKGFAPGSEQAVRMVFELLRLNASGYRIYLFYP